ncbi:MAG: allophanate hydrolase, partial [Pseudomonadota bacterium]
MDAAAMPFRSPRFADLRAAYAAGLSPETAIAEVYRRIAAHGDPGVFLDLRPEAELRAEARALGAYDPARPLWGLPFAVKDNIDAQGRPTTAGCPEFAYAAEEDAVCVARLRAAGALLIGKTNLDQFATGLVGLRTPYPAPRNAVDPALAPGGSSSGSAVAVAAGLVSFALGTDTAGSGRVPAALNDIVGLKPTRGRISTRGVVPACRSIDVVSIFALSCEDAAAAFAVAAAYDPDDPFSAPGAEQERIGFGPAPRIAAPAEASLDFDGDADAAAAFAHALARASELFGAEIRRIDFTPFYEVAALLYDGPWVAERLSVVEDFMARHADALHPVTREVIETARGYSAADAFRARYRLEALRRRIEIEIADVDVLLTPSIPAPATVSAVAREPIAANAKLGRYTNFVNLLDMCAVSVPTGGRADGRPSGVSLLARGGADAALARLGARLHAACGAASGALPPAPPPSAPAEDPTPPGAGEIALCVVGAHMSGLPLNRELVSRGARFLEATRTAPCYRLFALDLSPPRPGMIRDAEGGGALEVELWALPRR